MKDGIWKEKKEKEEDEGNINELWMQKRKEIRGDSKGWKRDMKEEVKEEE